MLRTNTGELLNSFRASVGHVLDRYGVDKKWIGTPIPQDFNPVPTYYKRVTTVDEMTLRQATDSERVMWDVFLCQAQEILEELYRDIGIHLTNVVGFAVNDDEIQCMRESSDTRLLDACQNTMFMLYTNCRIVQEPISHKVDVTLVLHALAGKKEST